MGNKVFKKKEKKFQKSNYVLDENEIERLMNDTGFKKEEIIEYYEQFGKVCSNGELDKNDFVDFFAELRPDKDAEMLSKQFFNAFDTDRSGRVDFREFLNAISLTSDTDPKRKLEFAFKMYDTDHDNKLSLKEIEKIIIGIYKFNGQKDQSGSKDPKKVAKKLLDKYDLDKSGDITQEEFIEGILTDSTLQAIKSFSILDNSKKINKKKLSIVSRASRRLSFKN